MSGPPPEAAPPAAGGSLVLVGTPIGNLGDLSPRAVEALEAADLVCCEDTRRTGRLLEHAGVSGARLRRVDEHTETEAIGDVCELLAAGATVAVVTDAGMPAVTDPGGRLVAACAAAGHTVTVVPGPSAGLAALAVSGLPAGRFCFEGFLPRKGKARAERLEQIARDRRTTVVYESPHRLRSCLEDLAGACGPSRTGVVARELTKLHEEVVRGSLAELCEWASGPVKGEVVIVVAGTAEDSPAATDEELLAAAQALVTGGMSRRDAAAAAAAAHGVSRRRVYNLMT
ncbi:MAG: 16S rRNA (cytidine(1402)-2'-O)-methyltransferase [Acidimicrobiaceae bacterium]|nr:16S rRNA (cytidine(1402)-2'-O)-methyltransferase [Acidimicrobiaceae bacterium]MDE0517413.1 16S rRNA (cytidine(1402)-2'-O)-methyltransferase [Acidimicrobiaceae bacterium]MDE0655042.1 16S rRNA (cytidine(1402)-2'-O)-methyltransferase [Acidimicrobiaceae bacterium]MXZ96244.1 16S rRNA (cytidine(1402)-2'-O)-methyltransferase [Acidimicrobiaceae bacterium]MYF44301.1 16S rRNA (cytidine(1402)-2'-O)-methyltransferase [Acidimicrobiaceae bacterium]